MRAGELEQQAVVHSYYGMTISVPATIMAIGFWMFFINIFATARIYFKNR